MESRWSSAIEVVVAVVVRCVSLQFERLDCKTSWLHVRAPHEHATSQHPFSHVQAGG
jgi:hypothetical protein